MAVEFSYETPCARSFLLGEFNGYIGDVLCHVFFKQAAPFV